MGLTRLARLAAPNGSGFCCRNPRPDSRGFSASGRGRFVRLNFACSAAARAILYDGNGNLVKKAQEHGVRHLPCAPLQVLRFG
jgi:hypothetical protein